MTVSIHDDIEPETNRVRAARRALNAYKVIRTVRADEPERDHEGMPYEPQAWLDWHEHDYQPAARTLSEALDSLELALGDEFPGAAPVQLRPAVSADHRRTLVARMTGATVKGTGAATKPRPRPVTRKRQPATERFTAAVLVGFLEGAWNAIIDRHPEIPEVVVIIGSGTTGRQAKFGHYASSRWQDGRRRLPEVFISGEGLKRPAAEVFTTLLHEAAHALADVRGIKDTSRQGRWHNKQFAALADELGLDTTKDERLGYSTCTLRPETQAHYQHKLDILQDALSVYRHPEILASKAGKSNNALACSCECPRRIRVSRSVLDEGPITCTVCDTPFEPDQA